MLSYLIEFINLSTRILAYWLDLNINPSFYIFKKNFKLSLNIFRGPKNSTSSNYFDSLRYSLYERVLLAILSALKPSWMSSV
jgi:hypothetical protein